MVSRTSRPSTREPFALLEPYAVAGTLLAGLASWLGVEQGEVPALVLVCWFLFLVDRPGAGVATRDAWRWPVCVTVAGLAGVLTILREGDPFLLRITAGEMAALLSLLSAGAPFLLLPQYRGGELADRRARRRALRG